MSFYLIFIMSVVIALSYWLEEHTKWVAHISGTVLIIIIASILGSIDIIPSSLGIYESQFKWIVPLGIALMLLAFNPKDLLKINKDFIFCFVLGAVGTCIGAIVAGYIFKTYLPDDYWRISAQLTGSFIGGYENAVSIGSGLNTPTPVFISVFAGDSILTTAWIIINSIQGRNIKGSQAVAKDGPIKTASGLFDTTSASITVAVAVSIVMLSYYIYEHTQIAPKILWVSIIATLVTFTSLRNRFSGSYILGSMLLSYFIFGCGAMSNVVGLFSNLSILLLFPVIIVSIHAVILFGIAKIFKIKKEIVIIASQSLIGGPATALALVSARKWEYQFEAVALGLLGYAVGNYCGFGVGWVLK